MEIPWHNTRRLAVLVGPFSFLWLEGWNPECVRPRCLLGRYRDHLEKQEQMALARTSRWKGVHCALVCSFLRD